MSTTLNDHLKKAQALFFDFDGTIVDSLPLFYQIYLDFLKEFGIEGSQEEFDRLNGASVKEIIESFKRTHEISGSELEMLELYFKKVHHAYQYQVEFFPGILSFLSAAQKMGYQLVIVSSAPKHFIEEFLRLKNIDSWFDSIVTLESGHKGKPAADIYLDALKTTQLDPKEVLVFEDSKNGVLSAEAAGLSACVVGGEETFSHEIKVADWASVQQGLPSFRAVKLSNEIKFELLKEKKEPPFAYQTYWEEMKQEPERFFDGKIFQIESFHPKKVIGSWADYGLYAVTQIKKESVPSFWTGGVMALCVQEGRVLMARRSEKVFQYPGYWEIAPAGSISPISGQEVNPRSLIEQEAREELGTLLEDIKPLVALVDRESSLIDFVYAAKIPKETGIQLSSEYDVHEWVPLNELKSFFEAKEIIPAIKNFLEIFSQFDQSEILK